MSYARVKEREGPIPFSTKVYQGVGAWPDTFKNFAFNTFLLFYYSQVLGLPASTASVAIGIALVVDAITDPWVGSLSDNLRTPLGRRHPFMYAAVAPLGLSLFLVFSPPDGLGGTTLFAWLLATVVMTRVSLTFFLVPWNAMFAEFSDDYEERTAILTYRWAIGWIGGVTFPALCWTFIFHATDEYAFGQRNPEAYAVFAPVVALVVAGAALFTTHMTRREIPYLYHKSETAEGGSLMREMGLALANRNFLRVFVAFLTVAIIAGTNGAFELYMQTYFWGLTAEDLRWFAIAIIGAIAAFALVVPLQARFDKRTLLLATSIISLVNGMAFVSLRFADILPANGDPWLLPILITNTTFRACLGTLTGIVVGSMIADMLDEQELDTGRRQEGVFNAAIAFSLKVTSGVGVMVGGILLDYVIRFPRNVDPADIDPNVVFVLGLTDGIVVPVFYLIPLYLLSRYTLTRERFAEIRLALEQRRASQSNQTLARARVEQ